MAPVRPASMKSSLFSRKREPRNDPSAVQTPEQIEAYYRNVKEGDRAAIRETQGGLLNFKMATVTGTKRGRVYLDQSGWGGNAFYMKSGKDCWAPTGQSSLAVPTSELEEWVKANPRGTFDWS